MYRVCYNICFENPACPRALVPFLALPSALPLLSISAPLILSIIIHM